MVMTLFDPAAVVRSFLDGAVAGDVEAVGGSVTEHVVGWSPRLFVRSRQELLDAIADRDGVLTNIETFVDVNLVGNKAIAEWSIMADHTGRIVLRDGVSIEATGRRLHLTGATIAEFDGERIAAFRQYFDDLAIVEQALSA